MKPPVCVLLMFLSETDSLNGEPLYQLVVQQLRQLGVAGATVTAGIMGLGRHHRVHHKGLFGITDERPVTIMAVDEEANIRAAVPAIRELAPEAVMLVTGAELIP